MEIKTLNPRLSHDQIAKDVGCSNSTLLRYRQDIKMFSLYQIPSNSHKRTQKTSNDIDRHQMTSREASLIVYSVTDTVASAKTVETKNKLKGVG